MTSLFTTVSKPIMIVPISKPIPERQGKGSRPNSRAALARYQFKPGQSGNPGGMPEGTPRVYSAYRRLLAMTPEELAIGEPRNGAEIRAAEQFKRACDPYARPTLNYAGIEVLRFPGLRHEFVSAAGDSPAVSVTAFMELLGHKNLKTTMR